MAPAPQQRGGQQFEHKGQHGVSETQGRQAFAAARHIGIRESNGKAKPAAMARLSLATKFHTPNTAPLSFWRSPRSAAMAAGKARSAPSARPDIRQINAKNAVSPAPSSPAPANAITDKAMASSQARTRPMRPANTTQPGSDKAPARKYKPSKGPLTGSFFNTSATKKRNSVAGNAAAMPLARNTVNRRRNAPSASTRFRLCIKGVAGAALDTRPTAATLSCKKNHAAAGNSSASNTQESRPVPTARSAANNAGRAAASNTPSRPKPSREAVSRVRTRGSALKAAPCA
jgi:hypothetical protein